jgi:hypothetical protein
LTVGKAGGGAEEVERTLDYWRGEERDRGSIAGCFWGYIYIYINPFEP